MARKIILAVPLTLLLAGCATAGTTTTAARPGDRAQGHCLADAPPGSPAAGPRPLFFLLCIQAP